MQIEELAAREAIRETIARYAHAVDSGKFDEVVALFTRDGVLEVQGEPVARGHDELRAFFGGVQTDLADISTVPMIKHNVTNVSIELDGPTTARARCYFLAVTETGVDHWGRYRDRLVAMGHDWRFSHRSVRTDGAVPGGFADKTGRA